MKDTLTHISIVMDRSGSMASVAKEAENAINHFIVDQKNQPGECTLFFIDFDTEAPHRVVYDGGIQDASEYMLDPRGMTPLLDAIGWTIIQTGKRLDAMPEADRPSKVIFVIQTDGLENASREFTWEGVRDLIKEQTDTYAWQFIFLGMGLDTFKQGDALGIQNTVSTVANNAATHDSTYSVLSANTTAYRSGAAQTMGGMRGMHVNAMGKVYDNDGNEIDPQTGKIKAQSTT
jgi:hypothetical protein